MSIKIETAAVVSAANDIAGKNQKIREDFSEMEKAINRLNNCWDGNVSEQALQVFGNIKTSYNDNRFNVINDLVGFLYKQVGEAYDNTESAIQSAASAFK